MDVVYPVRPGDANDELRYSLRSLANIPHGRVWIVGYKPTWVTGVEHIDGNQFGPHANVYENIRAAMNCPDVSDEVIIFNDDFFVTERIAEIPRLYRSTLAEHIALPRVQRNRGWWLDSLNATLVCLQVHGITDPLSYELHVPVVVNKRKMADTLAAFAQVTPVNPPQWRTLYGNLYAAGGTRQADVKQYGAGEMKRPFHSTDDRSFVHYRNGLDYLFRAPSPYEITQ